MTEIGYWGGPPKTTTMDYRLAQINNALVSHTIPFPSIGYGFLYIEKITTINSAEIISDRIWIH
jgi:hypothetical protein